MLIQSQLPELERECGYLSLYGKNKERESGSACVAVGDDEEKAGKTKTVHRRLYRWWYMQSSCRFGGIKTKEAQTDIPPRTLASAYSALLASI